MPLCKIRYWTAGIQSFTVMLVASRIQKTSAIFSPIKANLLTKFMFLLGSVHHLCNTQSCLSKPLSKTAVKKKLNIVCDHGIEIWSFWNNQRGNWQCSRNLSLWPITRDANQLWRIRSRIRDCVRLKKRTEDWKPLRLNSWKRKEYIIRELQQMFQLLP